MLGTVVEYKNRNHTIFALVKYQVMIGTAIKQFFQELLNRWIIMEGDYDIPSEFFSFDNLKYVHWELDAHARQIKIKLRPELTS